MHEVWVSGLFGEVGRGEGGTLAISVVFYLKVRDLKHKGQNIDTCLTLVLDI